MRPWFYVWLKKEIDINSPEVIGEVDGNGNTKLRYGDHVDVVVFIDAWEYDYIESIKVTFEGESVELDFDELNGDWIYKTFSTYLNDDFADKIEALLVLK